MLRFGAHMSLALLSLGLLPPPHDTSASSRFHDSQDAMNVLLQLYVYHLIATNQHDLVPLYCCHMRADVRHEVYALYLGLLTGTAPAALCARVFEQASMYFEAWAAAGRGDVVPEEIVGIVEEVAEQSRWEVAGGPVRRAESAGWVWLSPLTLRYAVSHTNQVLREFACGGAAAAAANKLMSLLPAELLNVLPLSVARREKMAAGYEESLALALQETACWQLYFEANSVWQQWEVDPSKEEEEEAKKRRDLGQILIEHYMDYMKQAALDTIGLLPDPLPVMSFLRLILAAESAQESSEEAEGREYPGLPTNKASLLVEQLSAALDQQLTSSNHSGLTAQVELVQPEGRGEGQALIMVHATWQSPRAMIDAARLLSLLVKGVLADGLPSMQILPRKLPGKPNVQVVNMEGTERAQAQLCRFILWPRIFLRCGSLREGLLLLGSDEDPGKELIHLLTGSGEDFEDNFRWFFSSHELRQYLELERRSQIAILARAQPGTTAPGTAAP